MALNIKNKKVEALVEAVVALTGESKTEAIRKALEERRQKIALRIQPGNASRRKREFMEREIWNKVPASELGRRMTREEKEEILGQEIE